MILLFTSNNVASLNIAKKLIGSHGFEEKAENEWERDGIRLIDTKAPTVLEVPTDFETDCIVVLSSHRSKAGGKMLTAHFPGNWGEASMGGDSRTLNKAYGSKLKALMLELKKSNERLGWPLFLEADHHGPTCEIPIMFVEIGSTETDWNDEKAAETVAGAVSEFLKRERTYETVFGVGGGHYSQEFTDMVLETDTAIGHIAPKYAIDGIEEDTFRQAIEKNVEKITRVVMLKKGTNSSQKKRIERLCEISGVACELV